MMGRLLMFLMAGALAAPAFAQAPVQLYPRATPGAPAQAPAPEPARPVAPPAPAPSAVPSEPQPAAPRGIAVTPLPPTAPAPQTPAAVQPVPTDAVLAAVEGFYGALARGDGLRANEFLVPEKRNQGAYEAAAMTRFYSAMREPLQLIGIGRLDPEVVRVRYAYTHQSGRRCDGVADVTVRRIDGRALIERIRSLSGC